MPALNAYRRKKMRSQLGVASLFSMSFIEGCRAVPHRSFLPPPKPKCPISSPRSAFCSDSLNVRPIAIVSPTDFICTVKTGSASGNFSNVQRGNFVTT